MSFLAHAPLARRLSLAVGIIVSILALGLGVGLGLQAGRVERRTVSENLEAATRTLASGVDPADLDSVLDNPDEEATPYAIVLDQMRRASAASLRKATFYSFARTDSGWAFVVDGYEGEDHSPPLSLYTLDDSATSRLLDDALRTGSSRDERLVADQWGVWMSAFARVPGTRLPVLIGVDVPASDLRRREIRTLALAIGISLLGALLAGFATRTLVHRGLARDLGQAAHQVSALQRGDLSAHPVAATGDELEAIGHARNATAAHLRAVVGRERVDWDEVRQKLSDSALLALLLENGPAPLLVLDAGGRIRHANAACARLLLRWGKDPSHLAGTSLEAVHPSLPPLPESAIRLQVGDETWMFRVDAVAGDDGSLLAWQGSFEDITGALRLEEARRQAERQQELLREEARERDRRIHAEEVERNRILSAQIQSLLGHVRRLEEGDLTGTTPLLEAGGVAELARGLDSLVVVLREQMSALGSGASSLSGHARTMEEASLDLDLEARRTKEEVDAARTEASEAQNILSKASRTCLELVGEIEGVSRSSREALDAASRAHAVASDARQQVDKLEEAGRRISTISTLVSDIARQTSLLAINAAVEAAHAGEAGKGFAVVAAEVQQLARKTREATSTIDDSLTEIRDGTVETTRILTRIEDAVGTIRTLQKGVDQAVERQTESTRHIAEETRRARERAGAVESHLGQVENAARRTSAAAHQGQDQARGLALLASDLEAMVARFRT